MGDVISTGYPSTYATTVSFAYSPPQRVPGIDCSVWQDDNSTPQKMDFGKAVAAGARFVFIKASQGTWLDEDFTYNWKAAKEAGLYRGAYHYLDWSALGKVQADFFCGVLRNDPGELAPVVDYECRKNVTKDAILWLNTFLAVLRGERGEVMIYTSPDYWKNYGSTNEYYALFPLWIANHDAIKPIVPKPWTDWTFWQWTDKGDGRKYGAESAGLDMNWYNGDWSDFTKILLGLVHPPDITIPEDEYDRGWNDCVAEATERIEGLYR
ncbi:glycoside hydrolase family 25 protein [Candidatus Magnetobacterium casense]|nr:glycoside hydrolase family 25 protein [Candidatus Magnetobacterium casensis]